MINYSELVGKTVRVTMKDGSVRSGYVLTHTPALDDDFGIETIGLMPNETARHGACVDVPDIVQVNILS